MPNGLVQIRLRISHAGRPPLTHAWAAAGRTVLSLSDRAADALGLADLNMRKLMRNPVGVGLSSGNSTEHLK
jgi:hypothetical protein